MKICGEEIVNMKKLIVFLFILSAVFLFAWPKTDVEAIGGTVNVSVRSIFDAENTVTNNLNAQTYGTSVSLDAQLGSQSGYSFAFWAVNGVYRPDLALATSPFVVTSDMSIDAYFSSDTQHLVTFIDSNYRVLKAEHVSNNGTATAPGTLPTKPGLVVAGTPWKELGGVKTTLDSITEDIIFVLQYVESNLNTYNLTVNGESQGTKAYNELVSVTAAATSGENQFTCWKEGTKVVSYDLTYKFTMVSSRNLTASYEACAVVPIVNMSQDLEVRSGHRTLLTQFDLPSGYELIEYGLLISMTDNTDLIVVNGSGVTALQTDVYNPTTQEYVMSLPNDDVVKTRAYVVYKNGETIDYAYSEMIKFTYDVTFESNGGSSVTTQSILKGQTISEPTDPTKSLKVFGGWYVDSGLTTEWNFSTPITQNTTLYAKWNNGLFIYEIYGAGNSAGATFQNDYVVLYNATPNSILLTGYSLQYASATGTTWNNKVSLNGTINAGDYFLVQLAGGTTNGSVLPVTPDQSSTSINMSGTAGKIALVNTITSLTGANPSSDSTVIDFVGFGSTANGYEGSGPTPAPSLTLSVKRIAFEDTNNNSTDFTSVNASLSYLTTP